MPQKWLTLSPSSKPINRHCSYVSLQTPHLRCSNKVNQQCSHKSNADKIGKIARVQKTKPSITIDMSETKEVRQEVYSLYKMIDSLEHDMEKLRTQHQNDSKTITYQQNLITQLKDNIAIMQQNSFLSASYHTQIGNLKTQISLQMYQKQEMVREVRSLVQKVQLLKEENYSLNRRLETQIKSKNQCKNKELTLIQKYPKLQRNISYGCIKQKKIIIKENSIDKLINDMKKQRYSTIDQIDRLLQD